MLEIYSIQTMKLEKQFVSQKCTQNKILPTDTTYLKTVVIKSFFELQLTKIKLIIFDFVFTSLDNDEEVYNCY
jgi:hypothetical protein